MQKNKMIERSDREFEGKYYSIEQYQAELQKEFEHASKMLGKEFVENPNGYQVISGDHRTALQEYGPNIIGMTHFQAGANMFHKGYIIRAETENGSEANELINHIQEELALLTKVDGMTKYKAAEITNSKGKRLFAETIHFCEPFVDQGFIVYINEV